jgi:mutator protein MutT
LSLKLSDDRALALVVAALIERDGRFLICRRPLDKHHGGLWEFPGGKVKPGESPADALGRELSEELTLHLLDMAPAVFAATDADAGVEVKFYPAVVEGDPRTVEHTELAWVPEAELIDYALPPSDRLLVETRFGVSLVQPKLTGRSEERPLCTMRS